VGEHEAEDAVQAAFVRLLLAGEPMSYSTGPPPRRFHQIQERWLANQPPARTLRGLQTELDRFRAYYNTTRPHRALGRHTPQDAFHARPKALPTGAAVFDGHYRRSTATTGGEQGHRRHVRWHPREQIVLEPAKSSHALPREIGETGHKGGHSASMR
jgi:Integrase core domain